MKRGARFPLGPGNSSRKTTAKLVQQQADLTLRFQPAKHQHLVYLALLVGLPPEHHWLPSRSAAYRRLPRCVHDPPSGLFSPVYTFRSRGARSRPPEPLNPLRLPNPRSCSSCSLIRSKTFLSPKLIPPTPGPGAVLPRGVFEVQGKGAPYRGRWRADLGNRRP